MSSGCSPTGWLKVRPPTRSRASSTLTSSPAPASSRAAVSPARPAPTTTTSQSCIAVSIPLRAAAVALRQADLSVDHRDDAPAHPGPPVDHLDLEQARPPHLLALPDHEALATG